MTWLQSFLAAFLAVATVIYVMRAIAIRRAGNPSWTRWAWVAVLFAVALIVNVIALVLSA
ncbi:MAG: hypothetical protein KGQ95_03860 [Acidobacteria bacterium]|nr:hypothetical protein [Acidobacteriota bacterium]